MRIGGFQPLTLSDYPGHTACVIYTAGCNFRCAYCHNPNLIHPDRYPPHYPQEKIFTELESRRDFLEGAVLCGGEPTMHHALPEFAGRIKDLGFKIKLDTNGTNPAMLKNMLADGLLDYVAMDIKAPFEKYALVAGVEMDFSCVEQSFNLLCSAGVTVEFRTTKNAALSNSDIATIRAKIGGKCRFTVQEQTKSS